MKREAIGHPKAIDLAHRLGVPVYQVTGILTHLWAFVSEYTPDGEIGRYPACVIAQKIGYEADPDHLIHGLTESHFLDICEGKIVVHDWADHCEDSVHRRLARQGKTFWNGQLPSMSRLTARERAEAENRYGVRPTCAQRAPEMRPTCARNAPLPLPLPLPLPSDPNSCMYNHRATKIRGGAGGDVQAGACAPSENDADAIDQNQANSEPDPKTEPDAPVPMPENRTLAGQGCDFGAGVVCSDVQNEPGALQAVLPGTPEPAKKTTPADVYAAWNEAASRCSIHAARELTEARKTSIRARLKSATWAASWRQALAEIEASPFHNGANDRNWRANLDYFLRPDTATKILERAQNKPMFARPGTHPGDIDDSAGWAE